MTIHHDLPTADDLRSLAQPRDHAVTIYLSTAQGPEGRTRARTALKSALDRALAHFKAQEDLSTAQEKGLREQARLLEVDGDLWGALSSSLALFLTPDSHQEYALPNALEEEWQASRWFDLGQLVRSVAAHQRAFALGISANGWTLWEATPTSRAAELEVPGHSEVADAATATNRDVMPGRSPAEERAGDGGRKFLVSAYAKKVSELVAADLTRRDPSGRIPLFVFAAEPILSMVSLEDSRRTLERVPGAADEIGADQVDAAIRERLPRINARRVSADLERMGNDMPRGLVVVEVPEIARAAVAGAVDTLVYEFTVNLLGDLDVDTGALDLSEDGDHDVLSRIALTVLEHGGSLVPVRDAEVRSDVWNGVAVAHLRYKS